MLGTRSRVLSSNIFALSFTLRLTVLFGYGIVHSRLPCGGDCGGGVKPRNWQPYYVGAVVMAGFAGSMLTFLLDAPWPEWVPPMLAAVALLPLRGER